MEQPNNTEPAEQPLTTQQQSEVKQLGEVDAGFVHTGNLKQTIATLGGVRPELVDRAMSVYQKTGFTPDLSAEGVASAEEQTKLSDAFNELTAKDNDGKYKHPYTLAYLSNDTVKMGQLLPQVKTLTQFEREQQQKGEFWMQASRASLYGFKDIASTVNNLTSVIPGYGDRRAYLEDLLPPEGAPIQAETGNAFAKAALGGVRLAPTLATGGLAGGAKAMALAFAAQSVSQTAEKAGAENKNVAGYLVDAFTNGNAAYWLGGGAVGSAAEKAVSGVAAGSVSGALKSIGIGAVQGSAAMTAQRAISEASDWVTQNKPDAQGFKPLDWVGNALKDVPQDLLLFGFMHSAGEINNYTAGRIKDRALADAGAKMAGLQEKEAPIAALRNTIEQSEDSDTAQVSAKAVVSHFQDENSFNKFAEDHNLKPEEVKAAAEKNDDISISKSRAAVNNNELFSALERSGELKIDGYNEESIKGLVEKAHEQAAKVVENMRAIQATLKSGGKLDIPDLPPELQKARTTLIKDQKSSIEHANVQTAILKAGLERLAAEKGQDLETWLKKNPIEIRKTSSKNLIEKVGDTFKGKRGALTYEGNTAIINLLEHADNSTLIHESSHLFYDKMTEYAKLEGASEQLKSDHAKLTEWMAGDHEKMAKAFEAYIMEGKAPRRDLVGAFERMSQWLTDIYRSVKQYIGVDKVPDEIKQIFDRRLASDEQIKQANEYYGLLDSIVAKHGTKPEDRAKAEDSQAKASQDLQSKQASKLLNAYKRSIGGEKEVRRTVETEYDKSPVGAALAASKEIGGLNYELFEAEYGDVAAIVQEKHPELFKKNGQGTLNDVAPNGDGDAFISELANSLPRKEAIEQGIKDWQTNTEHQLLSADAVKGGLTQADDSVLSSEATLKHQFAEMQMLKEEIERNGKKMEATLDQQARTQAAQIEIGERVGKEAGNPKQYLNKVRSLAKEIAKIADKETLSDKDRETLYNLKDKQIQNLIYAREAHYAAKQVEKIRQYTLPSAAAKRMDNMAFGEKGVMASVLNAIGQKTDLDPVFAKEIKSGSVGNLGAWLYDYNQNLWSVLPNEVFADKPWAEGGVMSMKYKDMKRVYEALQNVYREGRLSLANNQASRKAEGQAIAATAVKTMAKLKEVNLNDETNPLNAMMASWRKAGAYMMTRDHEAYAIDADMSGKGAFAGLIGEGATAQGLKENYLGKLLEETRQYHPELMAARKRIEKQMGGRLFMPERFGVKFDERFAKYGKTGGRLDFEALVAIITHTGTEDNYQKIKASYGLSDNDINKVFKLFKGKEVEAIRGLTGTMDKSKDELGKVYRGRHEESPKWLEGRKHTFEDADGKTVTVDGNYMPINHDHALIAKAADREIKQGDLNVDIDKDVNRSGYRQMNIGEGSFQERVDTSGDWRPISLKVFAPLERQLEWQARYIHQQPFLDKARTVVLDPEFRKAVINTLGQEHYTYIKNWVADMADPQRRSIKDEDAFKAWETYAKSAALTLRPDNFVAWQLSIVKSIREIGNGDFGKGMAAIREILPDIRGAEDILKMAGKMNDTQKAGMRQYIETIKELSPYMKSRWEMGEVHYSKAMLSLLSSKGAIRSDALQKIAKMNEALIQSNDIFCSYPVWMGAYKVRMKELASSNMPIEEQMKTAAQWADQKVRLIQPIRDLATSSEYAKDNAGQGVWGYIKNLPLFKTYLSLAASTVHANLQGVYRGYSSAASYSTHIAMDVIAEPMMQAIWRSWMWGGSVTALSLGLASASGIANSFGPIGTLAGRTMEELSGSGQNAVSRPKGFADVASKVLIPAPMSKVGHAIWDISEDAHKSFTHHRVDQSKYIKDGLEATQAATAMAIGVNIPVANAYKMAIGGVEKATGHNPVTGKKTKNRPLFPSQGGGLSIPTFKP